MHFYWHTLYICNFLHQLLHPYKFYGRDMSGILFLIFASCELLILPIIWTKFRVTVVYVIRTTYIDVLVYNRTKGQVSSDTYLSVSLENVKVSINWKYYMGSFSWT